MWNEDDSQTFIDYGRYFVPERETQFQIIRDLIPGQQEPFHLLELGCGDGLLAETVLAHFAACTVHGYDGSVEMLRQARHRLARYDNRFETRIFDLADDSWRQSSWNPLAVVSSLVIHHLDSQQKQDLFEDIYRMLTRGGAFIIADLIQPTSKAGLRVAADAWDVAVRRRAKDLDGNESGFEQFVHEKWNLYRYPDPSDKPSGLFEQLKWLEAAGFIEIDVHWLKAGHAIFGGRKRAA
jgi:tRNA (cmo5U34)-methyltransferase